MHECLNKFSIIKKQEQQNKNKTLCFSELIPHECKILGGQEGNLTNIHYEAEYNDSVMFLTFFLYTKLVGT